MSKNKRFLLFGGPGIGDTVIELIFAKALKDFDPSCKIDLLFSTTMGSEKTISELLKYQNNCIDSYYCYNRNRKIETIKTFIRLKRNKYLYSFACSTSFKSNSKPAIISRLIGTRSVIKVVEGKTGRIDIPVKINEQIHIVEQYGKLLEAIGIGYKLDGKVLDCSKLIHYQLKNKNKDRIVVICLGTNYTIFRYNGNPIYKQIKEWTIQRWIELSQLLSKNGFFVVIIGGEKEKDKLSKMEIPDLKNREILVGDTSIAESLSIVSQSSITVGADTGLMHCAAALGIPTLTLFGGTDANVWKPYSKQSYTISGRVSCSPCYGKSHAISCSERRCMNSISVNMVFEKLVQILNDSIN